MIPYEMITMAISTVTGAVIKLMAQSQKHKADQRKMEQEMLAERVNTH